jgi:hypothetical protein
MSIKGPLIKADDISQVGSGTASHVYQSRRGVWTDGDLS